MKVKNVWFMLHSSFANMFHVCLSGNLTDLRRRSLPTFQFGINLSDRYIYLWSTERKCTIHVIVDKLVTLQLFCAQYISSVVTRESNETIQGRCSSQLWPAGYERDHCCEGFPEFSRAGNSERCKFSLYNECNGAKSVGANSTYLIHESFSRQNNYILNLFCPRYNTRLWFFQETTVPFFILVKSRPVENCFL